MAKRDIVVIGCSAGGVRALRALVGELPGDLAATLFAVMHISPDSPGLLPEILSQATKLTVQHARNEVRFEPRTMYIAPPNRHLLINEIGAMRLTQGPKENRFRPAIDPLFHSAAVAFGPRVVGIILSGGQDDGVAGLAAIKAAGGLAVVQRPDEAEAPTLPRNALNNVEVDYTLAAAEIAALINALSHGDVAPQDPIEITPMKKKELEIELRQADEGHELRSDFFELGSPSMLTCPECHGALLRMSDGNMLRFRCHTGHAFTADSLLSALSERVEDALWNSVRALEETAMLLGHMASHVRAHDDATAGEFRVAAKDALGRAKAVRAILSNGEDTIAEGSVAGSTH